MPQHQVIGAKVPRTVRTPRAKAPSRQPPASLQRVSARVARPSVRTHISRRVATSTVKPSRLPNDGKDLKDFLGSKASKESEDPSLPSYYNFISSTPLSHNESPSSAFGLKSRIYYLETYGCQMNVADSELVHSILHNAGLDHTPHIHEADVILINTCAIREGAEQRIWGRLGQFRGIANERHKMTVAMEKQAALLEAAQAKGEVETDATPSSQAAEFASIVAPEDQGCGHGQGHGLQYDAQAELRTPTKAAETAPEPAGSTCGTNGFTPVPPSNETTTPTSTKSKLTPRIHFDSGNVPRGATVAEGLTRRFKEHAPVVGVLGCMAERLKSRLIEKDKVVDIVVGPDSYRDLPRLIKLVEGGKVSMNVQLSLEETYGDIIPIRKESNSVSAFVSITRGCNNMCSYCIVPYTRGTERSRAHESILKEIRMLADQGYKEVTLLGQNVNSYNDISGLEGSVPLQKTFDAGAEGFKNISRRRVHGVNFAQLLEMVASAVPEMRVRFTSPHPKDFSPEVINVISSHYNIAKQLHMPAQSGSTTMLQRMRRGYSRDAYLKLIASIREKMPGMAFSTDMISGFCLETEQEHHDTLTLMQKVQYDHAFMFKYSQRAKTHAEHAYPDDITDEVKGERLLDVIDTYETVQQLKQQQEVGSIHLVLVDGESKRQFHDDKVNANGEVTTSKENRQQLTGRTDTNKTVNFENLTVPFLETADAIDAFVPPVDVNDALQQVTHKASAHSDNAGIQPGNYLAVYVTKALRNSLLGVPLFTTNLQVYGSARAEWSKLANKCVDMATVETLFNPDNGKLLATGAVLPEPEAAVATL